MIQLDDVNTELMPNGDLLIDFHPTLNVKLRYTLSEEGLRIFRWVEKSSYKWEEGIWDYGVRLVADDELYQSSEATRKFVSVIPEDLRCRIQMFTIYQMTVIYWVLRDYKMYDLLISNPVLFWMLIYKANTCYWSQSQIQSLVAQKQRKILHRIAGVDSNTAVAFVRKIILGQGERQKFSIINWAVNQPACIKAARHLTHVSFPALYQLYKSPELFDTDMVPMVLAALSENIYYSDTGSSKNKVGSIPDLSKVMFNEYCITDDFDEVKKIKQLWGDTERLGLALQLQHVSKQLSKFHSVTKLQQLHDRWTSRLTLLNIGMDKYSIKLPLPVVEGNDWIQAIRTTGELDDEGKIMNHCIASYTREVMQGESFIYRVLKPQRATLEIKIHNNKPVLHQICLQKNGIPSNETKNAVSKWLKDNIKNK